jgi:eukaryotic-like serine/threonine-protein kinase
MTRVLGGYEILGELKRGGMGEVLLGRRRGAHGFERLCAIKTMRAERRADPELRTMFLDEARLLARLHHPAIAQVYDFGEEDGVLYLVLELVAGVSFSRLAQLRPPPEVAVAAMAEAMNGLHAAHELCDEHGEPLGVVHRDVSPQNLLLTFDGRVKVLDFGIALMRGRAAPETELGSVKGKPAYMAPEQLVGDAVDRRTDVYAAGIVLHELCTGERLFQSDSPFVVARRIEQGLIDPPSKSAGALPAGLDELVLRALARDPADRFATAGAMAAALERMARDVDGESLGAFAERELAAERDEHRQMLRRLGGGEAVVAASSVAPGAGRATGVVTLKDDLDTGQVATKSTTGIPLVRPRRWGVIVLGLAAALGIGVAGLLVSPDEDADPPAPPPSTWLLPSALPSAATPVTTATPAISDHPPPTPSAPPPSPAPRALPPASAQPAPPPPASEPSAQPAADNGYVTIGAEPYALVQLDGVPLGPTPIIRRPVAPGSHTVVLTSPDTGKVRLSTAVQVEAGKVANVGVR